MRLEENLLRRIGASTLADVDDAGIESLEVAVTEANELVEKGDEPGARRLLLAELAAARLWPRQARQRVAAADSVVQRRGAYRSSKRLAGDVIVRLISTVDSAGILLGTKVDLSDGDHVRGDLAIHCCADGDNVCCCHARSDDSGYLSEKL